MRIACQSCHRQYDVSHLEPGAHVRCSCGELLEVREVEARDAPMLRCSSCGAQLEEKRKDCGFCGSEIQLAEKGWGDSCPECFARLVKGARFCSSCGVEQRNEAVLQPLQDKACPRCDGQLALRELAKGSITECTSCGGIWLPEEVFEETAAQGESSPVAMAMAHRKAAPRGERKLEEVRYLKCPVCDEFMNRQNFARISGVIIDWCKGHGYWLDHGEIEAILNFVREGGLETAAQKARMQEDLKRHRDNSRIRIPSYRADGGDPRGSVLHQGSGLADILGNLIDRFFR